MTRDDSSIRPWIRILWQFTVLGGMLWPASLLPQDSSAPPADGMCLWLKADAGIVSDDQSRVIEWQDQSGNDNNAEAENDDYWGIYPPLLVENAVNGRPAVQFGGERNTAFDLPGVLSGAQECELFFVLRKNPDLSGDLFDDNDLGELFGGATSYPNAVGEIDDGTGIQTNTGKPAQDITRYSVYNVSVSQIEKVARLNGVGYFAQNLDADSVNFGDSMRLGVVSHGEWYAGFRGAIAEMIVYNRALSDGERTGAIAYLHKKYAVIPAPVAPSSLTADLALTGRISLHWSPGSADQYVYDIQRKSGSDPDYVTIATDVAKLCYTDTDAALQAGATYAYRVRAKNGLSAASDYCDPASIMYDPRAAPIPSAGISLWLRSDKGVVTEDVDGSVQVTAWQDQSGFGRDLAAQTAATAPDLKATDINGLPAVHFGGGRGGMTTSGFLAGAQTGEFFFVIKKDAPQQSGPLGGFYQADSGYDSCYGDGSNVITDNFLSNDSKAIVPTQDLCTYHVYNVAADSDTWRASLNGILQYSSDRVWWASIPPNETFWLGYGAHNYRSLCGSMTEVIFYDHVLSDDERAQVVGYLQGRYALVLSPPAPANLQTHVALNCAQLWLDWQPAAGQTAMFEVQRKGPQDVGFVTVAADLVKPFWRDTTVAPGNTYTYRVRAKNGVGAVSPFSNEAAGALSGTAPIPAGGMRLWLRSDTAVITDTVGANDFVTAWCDQSGKGNDAVGSRNTSSLGPQRITGGLNGVPAISLVSDSFSLPGFLNGAQQGELFLVLRKNNASSSETLGSFHEGHVCQYPDYSGMIQDNFLSSTSHSFAARASLGNYHVYGVASGPDGWTARVNGIPEFVSEENVVLNPDSAECALGSTAFSLGYATNYSFSGAMVEAIFYDRVLNADERSKVQQYLQDRYAVIPAPAVPLALGGNAPLLALVSEVRLAWQTGAVQEVVYEIQRKAAGDSDFATIATGLTQTSYVDSNVIAGSTYTYRIRAVNGLGVESAWGSEAVVVVPVRSTAVPDQGIRLWFRADSGVQTDASGNVLRWFDQSGCGNDATAPLHDGGNSVQVVPGAVNGRPALNIAGQAALDVPNAVLQGAAAGEVFVFQKKNHYYDGTYAKPLWPGTYYPYTDGRIQERFGSDVALVFAPTQTIYDYGSSLISVE